MGIFLYRQAQRHQAQAAEGAEETGQVLTFVSLKPVPRTQHCSEARIHVQCWQRVLTLCPLSSSSPCSMCTESSCLLERTPSVLASAQAGLSKRNQPKLCSKSSPLARAPKSYKQA